MTKIQSFTQLTTWQEGHKLVLQIYKITNKFPKQETYILVSQMLRSAISVTSNIAEGFTRIGKKEKKQFYYMAKASLTELQNQLIISKDVSYISSLTFNKLAEQTIVVNKLLSGLIRGLKKLP